MLFSTTLELLAATDTMEQVKRYIAISLGIMSLVGILKYIQRVQYQREQKALKRFQEGIFDDEDKVVPTVPRGKLLRKLRPTKEIIAFAGTKEKWFDPTYLKQVAKEVFTNFRDAWETHDFDLLRGYVTPEFFDEYYEKVTTKKGKDRPMSFADLRLSRMEIVHFNAAAKKENHAFTVLITAESLVEEDDEDEDEEADENEKVAYQEFWTFIRRKRWQLHRFRDITNSDAVQEQNVLATDWFKEFRDDVCTHPDNMDFVIPS